MSTKSKKVAGYVRVSHVGRRDNFSRRMSSGPRSSRWQRSAG
jgi:hypothetical protein